MKSGNRILIFTLVAIALIAVFMTVNSYYTQLNLYQDKELFKLDCMAMTIAGGINGEEHSQLVYRYPETSLADKARADSVYQKIYMEMEMSLHMTNVGSAVYTLVRDSSEEKFYKAITTDQAPWLAVLNELPGGADSLYNKGGVLGKYKHADGETRLGARYPVKNASGETVGALQVEETLTDFMQKSKQQILINVLLSLFFVLVIGIFMFFSVKSILRRLQRVAAERAEVEALRQELIANVSHDLRTPLASIHGYIETLLMKQDTLDKEQTTKYLNTTLQSTDKLRLLVEELFDLSKLESKERKLNIEKFSIGELASDVVSNFRISAQTKKVEVVSEISRDLPMVNADIALIDRVLQNLLANSVKFCNEGDTIKLTSELAGDRIWIHVTDTGEGIPDEDIPHVFDRFHKGKNPKSGTGLGLAIVKGILDLHKSEYRINSKLKAGTTFSFSLQVA